MHLPVRRRQNLWNATTHPVTGEKWEAKTEAGLGKAALSQSTRQGLSPSPHCFLGISLTATSRVGKKQQTGKIASEGGSQNLYRTGPREMFWQEGKAETGLWS